MRDVWGILLRVMLAGAIATILRQTRPQTSGPATQPSTQPQADYSHYIDTPPSMIKRQPISRLEWSSPASRPQR